MAGSPRDNVGLTNDQTITGSKVFQAASATAVPMVIRGADGQIANPFVVQTSDGTETARFSATGAMRLGATASAATGLAVRFMATTESPGVVGAILQAAPSQTAGMLEFRNSAGNNMTTINSAGVVNVYPGITNQTNARLINRGSYNAFEWGHSNQAGYGSTIGVEGGSGSPFVAFFGEHGATNNTYTTRGRRGIIMRGDPGTGGLLFSTVANNTGSDQVPYNVTTFSPHGSVVIAGNASADTERLVVVASSNQTQGIFQVRNSAGAAMINVTSHGHLNVLPVSTSNSTALFVRAAAPGAVAAEFRANAGGNQTADVAQFQNATGTAVMGFDADGRLRSFPATSDGNSLGGYVGRLAINFNGTIRYLGVYA